jgi:hypothetical protein
LKELIERCEFANLGSNSLERLKQLYRERQIRAQTEDSLRKALDG